MFTAVEPRRDDVLAAGEGIETMLALGTVLPRMPMAAALSAAHLAANVFPAALRRLYIARDNDPAGDGPWRSCATGRRRSGSRPSGCLLGSGTSTRICWPMAPTRFRQKCGSSSRPGTSPGFWACPAMPGTEIRKTVSRGRRIASVLDIAPRACESRDHGLPSGDRDGNRSSAGNGCVRDCFPQHPQGALHREAKTAPASAILR